MSLVITYAEVRRELGRFLAIGEDPTQWSTDDVTRVADIILRGSRRFYFPGPGVVEDASLLNHDWSFLIQSLSETLAASTLAHDLPSDFVRMASLPSISGNEFPLTETSEQNIRNLENASSGEGEPTYYAIEITKPTASPLVYQIIVHPKPTEALTLEGDYVFSPTVASSTQAPIVTDDHAEAYLQALLASAEEIMNPETTTGFHRERFKEQLSYAIMRDKTIGGSHD